MPKSKKGKKGGKKAKAPKEPVMIDGVSPDDMSKEQLMDHINRFREELDREREERNYFQLERDKISTFWEITRRQFEQSKATLRNKDREMEDAEERHQVEIKVYKQKVKHLLYENQQNIAEIRGEAASQLRLQSTNHRDAERTMIGNQRVASKSTREAELAHEDNIKELRRENQQVQTELRDEFQREIREIEAKYEKRCKELRDQNELRRRTELHEVEQRKNSQINALMRRHEKAFSEIKNYYNDITLNNLAHINSLKEQIIGMKEKEERIEKDMAEVQAQNKKLEEPLKKAREEVEELTKKLANYEKDKVSLATTKKRLKLTLADMKKLAWKHEVLEQRFEKCKAERNELYNNFVKAIHEVQQKSGFKNLLLEKKLKSLVDTLEKKEAQLNEVLAASNLDPTALSAVTRKLEDVLDGKNAAIKDLQYELARVCKAHNDVLRTYESRLKSFGVPVEELGFKPLESAVAGQQLGQGPAGLVAAPT